MKIFLPREGSVNLTNNLNFYNKIVFYDLQKLKFSFVKFKKILLNAINLSLNIIHKYYINRE